MFRRAIRLRQLIGVGKVNAHLHVLGGHGERINIGVGGGCQGYFDAIVQTDTGDAAASLHVARLQISQGGRYAGGIAVCGIQDDGHCRALNGAGDGRAANLERHATVFLRRSCQAVGAGRGRRPGTERQDERDHQSCHYTLFHIGLSFALLDNLLLAVLDVDTLTGRLALHLAALQVVPCSGSKFFTLNS